MTIISDNGRLARAGRTLACLLASLLTIIVSVQLVCHHCQTHHHHEEKRRKFNVILKPGSSWFLSSPLYFRMRRSHSSHPTAFKRCICICFCICVFVYISMLLLTPVTFQNKCFSWRTLGVSRQLPDHPVLWLPWVPLCTHYHKVLLSWNCHYDAVSGSVIIWVPRC